LSDEKESPEGNGMFFSYVEWLFEGNILVVGLKFVWTGMWLTALTTFQFVEAAVIFGLGVAVWFVANDWQNWQVEWQ